MVETAAHLCDHVYPRLPVRQWALHIGALAFIHRFGSSLNGHVHFYVYVVDGVFDKHGAKVDELRLKPLELIARIAALLLQPRTHPRGFSVAVPAVRWVDAPDRVHYRRHARNRKILDHIGVDSEPLHISPARGPPLWDDCDAQMDEGVHIEPDWELAPASGTRL